MVCLAFGLLVIVARAPFIFWPEETMVFYRDKLFANAARTRMVLVIPLSLGLALTVTSLELQGVFPRIVTVLGMILTAGSAVFILIPNEIKDLMMKMLNLMSTGALRGIGIASVAVALVWMYASFIYLGT